MCARESGNDPHRGTEMILRLNPDRSRKTRQKTRIKNVDHSRIFGVYQKTPLISRSQRAPKSSSEIRRKRREAVFRSSLEKERRNWCLPPVRRTRGSHQSSNSGVARPVNLRPSTSANIESDRQESSCQIHRMRGEMQILNARFQLIEIFRERVDQHPDQRQR